MVRRIFIDIDGVLNDWVGFALHAVGIDVPLVDSSYAYWQSEWPDIIDAVQHFDPEHGWTADEFWNYLPDWVWSHAPLSQEAKWLVSYCQSLVGSDNVALLTAHSRDPQSAAGKVKWVDQHMPFMAGRMLIGRCKRMCAASDSLLIDDMDRQVDRFVTAGGCALFMPRPWNRAGRVENTQLYLETRIKEYVG